jgi:hypothetical protein
MLRINGLTVGLAAFAATGAIIVVPPPAPRVAAEASQAAQPADRAPALSGDTLAPRGEAPLAR